MNLKNKVMAEKINEGQMSYKYKRKVNLLMNPIYY